VSQDYCGFVGDCLRSVFDNQKKKTRLRETQLTKNAHTKSMWRSSLCLIRSNLFRPCQQPGHLGPSRVFLSLSSHVDSRNVFRNCLVRQHTTSTPTTSASANTQPVKPTPAQQQKHFTDIQHQSFMYQKLPSWCAPYLSLARVDRPIGVQLTLLVRF
jgi:hypothetical protein